MLTFIDSITSYIIHGSIHETAYTGLTPQRFFINISDTPDTPETSEATSELSN